MTLQTKWPIRLWSGLSGPLVNTGYTMTTDKILGRDTAGTGSIEELAIGNGLVLSGGELRLSNPYLYPKIIASGNIAWGTSGVLSGGSNLSYNATTGIVSANDVPNHSSNKYGCIICPHGSHEAWTVTQQTNGFVLNIWNRSGTSRIGYGGNVSVVIYQSSS